jgi:hypothetical protein
MAMVVALEYISFLLIYRTYQAPSRHRVYVSSPHAEEEQRRNCARDMRKMRAMKGFWTSK